MKRSLTVTPKRRNPRRHIYELLRQRILSGALPPCSLVTSTPKMAARFRISYYTMHLALSDLVRDGLLIRQNGKGTFVSPDSERKKRPLTSHLALVMPIWRDIQTSGQSEEFLEILGGCTRGMSQSGGDLTVTSFPSTLHPGDLDNALGRILTCDGAIFFGVQYRELMKKLKARKFPFIVIGRDAAGLSSIHYDYELAIRLAVEHLLQHGYREIGYFGTLSGCDNIKFTIFSQVLRTNGIVPKTAWHQHCPFVEDADRAARQFLTHSDRPAAVFVDNHQKAVALMRNAEELQIDVPKQLAVMGYGTEMAGTTHTPMSLIAIPYEEMGYRGATRLDRIVRGLVVAPVQETVPPKEIIRCSCGCLNN